MAPSVKYQIFVSSTYDDLRQERQEVVRAVLEMGHIPVGMEMFSAGDEEQWKLITRHIDQSDYYVVVVAHRYGSVTLDGKSYTQKEYEYAASRNIPILGFIIDPAAPWPSDKIDTGKSKDALDGFTELMRKKPVGFWETARDLYGMCSIALGKAFAANPREGWVRAASSVGPEVTRELTRLSAENSMLREALEQAQAASEQAEEEEQRDTLRRLRIATRTLEYKEERGGEWIDAGQHRLIDVFRWLAPGLATEDEVEKMSKAVALHIRKGQKSFLIPTNWLRELLADFMAFDLVEPSPKRHSVNDPGDYWSLTEKGRELLKLFRRDILIDRGFESDADGEVDPLFNDDGDHGEWPNTGE